MRKKRRLYNFLIFSMCILIFLVILLICKEEDLYKKSKTVSKTKNTIENNLVQSDIKEEQKIKKETKEIYHTQHEEPVEVEEDTFSINYDNLIINSEDYASNFVNAVIKQLSYIPSEILIDFENQGWKICIVNEKEIYDKLSKREAQMHSKDEGNVIKGYTKINDKIIYLTYHSMTIRDNTTIHEIGHYYDITNGWPSYTEEYSNIFEKEKDSLNSTTTDISTNKELFAETFEYVILEEKGYENLQTYQYVKTLIYHE